MRKVLTSLVAIITFVGGVSVTAPTASAAMGGGATSAAERSVPSGIELVQYKHGHSARGQARGFRGNPGAVRGYRGGGPRAGYVRRGYAPRYYGGPRYGYRPYYRPYYGRPYYYDPGPAIAAGIIGLAASAAIANARPRGVRRSVAWCAAHYRSYDRRTRTYLGYDGRRHYC